MVFAIRPRIQGDLTQMKKFMNIMLAMALTTGLATVTLVAQDTTKKEEKKKGGKKGGKTDGDTTKKGGGKKGGGKKGKTEDTGKK